MTAHKSNGFGLQLDSGDWVFGWMRDGKLVPNADLWERLLNLCAQHQVEFEWVKGHAGTLENERCDTLSVQAAKSPDLPQDKGYEEPSAGTQNDRLDVV